eukprot:454213_1
MALTKRKQKTNLAHLEIQEQYIGHVIGKNGSHFKQIRENTNVLPIVVIKNEEELQTKYAKKKSIIEYLETVDIKYPVLIFKGFGDGVCLAKKMCCDKIKNIEQFKKNKKRFKVRKKLNGAKPLPVHVHNKSINSKNRTMSTKRIIKRSKNRPNNPYLKKKAYKKMEINKQYMSRGKQFNGNEQINASHSNKYFDYQNQHQFMKQETKRYLE